MARLCGSSPRHGYDWTDRYPAIAAAAAKLRAKSFTLDGEAVVTGEDGIAMFDALHRRHKASDAMLYAFDLLELNGKDLRPLPLGDRKAKLAQLLARARAGITYNEHADEDGAVVFRHARMLGLEGIVSKRLSAPYRSGHSLRGIYCLRQRTEADAIRAAAESGRRAVVALGPAISGWRWRSLCNSSGFRSP
jgi:bifunctional non-homologous end joining protein LigD